MLVETSGIKFSALLLLGGVNVTSELITYYLDRRIKNSYMYSQLVKTCDESYIRSLLFNGGERNFSSNFNDRFHLSESFSVLFCHCNRKFTNLKSRVMRCTAT